MRENNNSSSEPEDGAPVPLSGRDAVRAAFSRPSRAQAVVGVLLFAVGFAAATQVRNNERDDQYTGLRQADLIRVFDGLAGSSERADKEIDRLLKAKEDLQSSTGSRRVALEQARQEVDALNILAGLVPTTGPGVRITIDDTTGLVDADTMLDMVQELRAAGAEAMEFNDRIRVVAQTSIQKTSAGIEVGGELVEAPYVIDVIGEPTALVGSLDFPDGPKEQVEQDEGTLTTEQLEQVLIESTVEATRPEFAEPEDGQ